MGVELWFDPEALTLRRTRIEQQWPTLTLDAVEFRTGIDVPAAEAVVAAIWERYADLPSLYVLRREDEGGGSRGRGLVKGSHPSDRERLPLPRPRPRGCRGVSGSPGSRRTRWTVGRYGGSPESRPRSTMRSGCGGGGWTRRPWLFSSTRNPRSRMLGGFTPRGRAGSGSRPLSRAHPAPLIPQETIRTLGRPGARPADPTRGFRPMIMRRWGRCGVL